MPPAFVQAFAPVSGGSSSTQVQLALPSVVIGNIVAILIDWNTSSIAPSS